MKIPAPAVLPHDRAADGRIAPVDIPGRKPGLHPGPLPRSAIGRRWRLRRVRLAALPAPARRFPDDRSHPGPVTVTLAHGPVGVKIVLMPVTVAGQGGGAVLDGPWSG